MIRVDVSALRRSVLRLKRASDDAPDGLAGAAAEHLAEEASARTPVDTGRLRASWHARETGALTAVAYNPVEYASFVEFDTRHWISGNVVPGQRFLRDAMEETEAAMPEKVETRIREVMERALHG